MRASQTQIDELQTRAPKNGVRGGNHRRPRGQPRWQAELFILDEKKLLSQVPEDGTAVGNYWLRQRLGWEKPYYFRVRGRLIERKILSRGRGKGGAVRRLAQVSPADTPRKSAKPSIKEADLWVPVAKALEGGWPEILRHKNFLVQVTAKQGRRRTGGKFTRPDITIVAMDEYTYVPGKVLEVITVEVKREDGWDVAGVYETASHSGVANQSYLLIHAPDGLGSIPEKVRERFQKECLRFGVGLGLFQDPSSYDTYEFLVEADRKQPDPAETDRFIEQQLSKENRRKIAEWNGHAVID